MSDDAVAVPEDAPVPDWSGVFAELCPHCDEPYASADMDRHVATAHADLPACTARVDSEYGLYTCVLRAGHRSGHGEYCDYHVSARGPVGRTVWNDTAKGATPHKEQPEPIRGEDGRVVCTCTYDRRCGCGTSVLYEVKEQPGA